MKKYSLLSITLASAIGITGIFSYQSQSFASKLSNLKEEKQQVEDKNSSIESKINQKNSEIADINGKQDDLQNEIKQIDLNIEQTDQKIQEKQQVIEETKKKVEILKEEIIELRERIEDRKQLLHKRARALQTNGGSLNYLDIILNSNNFSELIDRVTAVTTLINADNEIINEQKRDQDILVKKQGDVEKKLANLQILKKELQVMKGKLDKQRGEKANILKKLGNQKQKLQKNKLSLEEEKAILSAQESAIKKAIQLEENRIVEDSSKKGEGVARDGGTSSTPPTSTGLFSRPTQGYISSEFGNRSFDGFHSGVDIAKGGTVPIVAAADGIVSKSYLSSSYGNAIFITHSVKGKVYTTVYAHMRSRVAAQGESVKKGQVIGYMGNTGISFGQHLHFEIHEGPWNLSKSNAVNPRKYVNF